jgi:hypothetical protein
LPSSITNPKSTSARFASNFEISPDACCTTDVELSGPQLTGWRVPPSQQLIKGSDDFITLFLQRSNQLSEILLGDRNDFERMQDNPLAFDSESWIEAGIGNLSKRRFIDQRHYDPATVIVIQGRLHNYDVRDTVAVSSGIAMNVELSH